MSNFHCAAPWRGLHINFRGDVKTCCAGDPNILGNLNKDRFEDILQSPKMLEIRESIKQGTPHEYCFNCVNAEKYGGYSERNWHNTLNSDFDVATADIQEYTPTLIDVRWSTTCNLTCNYCGPYCSSKWAALTGDTYKSGIRPYFQQVCDYLQKHQASVREVALVGGEPLLLPENEELLDILPDNCIVTLITNVSVDFEKNPIVKKLSNRKKVGWSMSFENTNDKLEYVRYGAKWDTVKSNVLKIKQMMQDNGQWGGIHAVYNIYSATSLREIGAFAREVGLNILWQPLHQPMYLDPFLHNDSVKQLCINELMRYKEEFELTDIEHEFFGAVEKKLAEPRSLTMDQQFKDHINEIETKYHPASKGKFKELWSDLAQELGM